MKIVPIIESESFDKYRMEGPWPFKTHKHHIKAPDHGQPHDHPQDFVTFVISGWYVERVFTTNGDTHEVMHRPQELFTITAGHIHKIIAVSPEPCWTFAMQFIEEPRIVWGYFEWRDGECWKRNHNEDDFHKHLF